MDQEFTLTKFKFKNFRPFKEWQEIEPKKLNLLIGPNNSGKSSLVELLTMCGGSPFPSRLNNEDGRLRSSHFENFTVVPSEPIRIILEIDYAEKKLNKTPICLDGFTLSKRISVELDYLPPGFDGVFKEINLCRMEIKDRDNSQLIFKGTTTEVDENFEIGWNAFYKSYLKSFHNKKIQYHDKGTSRPILTINPVKEMIIKNGELEDTEDFLKEFKIMGCDAKYLPYSKTHGMQIQTSYPSLFKKADHENPYFKSAVLDYQLITEERVDRYLQNKSEKRELILNPLELASFRYYFYFNLDSLMTNISKCIPKIDSIEHDKVKRESLYFRKEMEETSSFFAIPTDSNDQDKMDHWIKRLGIAETIETRELTDKYIQVFLKRHGKEVPLNLLGRGTQQMVLLISNLLCGPFNFRGNEDSYSSDKDKLEQSAIPGGINAIKYVQEPEINLHPKYQSETADLFLEIINDFRTSLLIETHSEYLVRKVQFLVSSKKLNPDDVEILYFEEINSENDGGKIRAIPIRKDGFLSDDFGPGFYDESARWTFELLKMNSIN